MDEQIFETRAAASGALADRMAFCLDRQLAELGNASIVVSGGSSPTPCFRFMSRKNLEWHNVQVMLSDERWVPNNHDDSNERLVRESLLVNSASRGDVLSIYQSDVSVEDRCIALQNDLPESGFACSMLGMGSDGHFASLFPDSENLLRGLDTESTEFYIPVRTAASTHERISMTLGALLRSREIQLLFFGDEKREVFERAKAGDSSLPVCSLIAQKNVPVTLFWAP